MTITHYWTFAYLSASGEVRHKPMESARDWFKQRCQDLLAKSDLPHRAIQRRLKTESDPLAKFCLRCFISQQIVYACQELAQRFGQAHGFSRRDLLPFVLDDDSLINPRPQTGYRPLATQVLESFDPQQSNLSTWTARLVRQKSDLNAFLLEHGVYLISPWAILNDTKQTQLEGALGDFHQLSTAEVKQADALLEGYHAVYRQERVEQRRSGRCTAPSTDQLRRIAAYLLEEYVLSLSERQVMQQLQVLAQRLRAYRIYNRSKVFPTETLDNPDQKVSVDALPAPDEDTDDGSEAFLKQYRQELQSSLDEALAAVVEQRVAYLTKRKGGEPRKFLDGLRLFHCMGEVMGAIALKLGYTRQDQVSSLLKLKHLRADVRHHLLILLRDRILPLAQTLSTPATLKDLDQRLDQALDEQTNAIILEAKAEASRRRDGPLKSLFSRRLCQYLDNRI
ncbi:MAG: hypothetical protein AAF289_00700 [Cyanobacteria bacterium P01_A01_bin.135]